jgi:two-component system nitrate/nitrite response regulator NarL
MEKSSTRVRVMVVDDHTLFRRGLISLLSDFDDIQVVGEAGDGNQAIDLISTQKPDIVLLDLNMPVMNGISTLAALRALNFPVHILMLTISQADEDLIGAIRNGADGYLLKNTEPEELRKSILRVCQGQAVLSPEVTASVLHALSQKKSTASPSLLSNRELEVLDCLFEGLTTSQIGSRLFISENTVKTHIRHILEKLESSNRAEAVSKATQLGLISRLP